MRLGAAVTLATATLLVTIAPSPAGASTHKPQLHQVGRAISGHGRSRASVRPRASRSSAKDAASSRAASAALAGLEAKGVGRSTGKAAPAVKPAVVGPPAPDQATLSGDPAPTDRVDAVALSQSDAGGAEPADAGVAVGPDQTVEMVNGAMLFSDRNGHAIVDMSQSDFFGLPQATFTTFASDPVIYYDVLRGRWIAADVSWDCAINQFPGDSAAYGHGFVDYLISDTSDAFGYWTESGYEWDDALPDRPTFGTSTDKLAFAANLFAMGPGGDSSHPGCASGAFQESHVVVADWTQLGPEFDDSVLKSADLPFPTVTDLRATMEQPVSTAEIRLIGSTDDATAADVVYLWVSGSAVAGDVSSDGFDLTADNVVAGFLDPPDPQQFSSTTLTTAVSGRPEGVVFHAGQLAFTSTYPCTPAGDSGVHDCVRVVTLGNADPTVEPTRLADVLLATVGRDDSFGGIGFTETGALFAAFTQSASSMFPVPVARYHSRSAAANAWTADDPLTTSITSFTGTLWGQYSILGSDDQNPGGIWVAGDVAENGSGDWLTVVHQLDLTMGSGYNPMPPTRVLDTRIGIGLTGRFLANTPRTLQIAGTNGIPSDAVAITANVTVTGQTKGGFVSLTPAPTATPTSSTINFPLGDNRANNTTSALGPDGSLSFVYRAAAGARTDLLLDVTGYFVQGSGDSYNPISPVRILDSRVGLGATKFHSNVPQKFQVGGVNGIPADAVAITANLTVTNQTRAGYAALTPTPTASPSTSTINFPLGDNRANGLTIPLAGDGSIAAVYKASSASADLLLDVTGYYSSTTGLSFYPIDPGRRVDTRLSLGAEGLNNGLSGAQGTTPRNATICGHFGVGLGAQAITGNLTITGQKSAGFVSITDTAQAKPATSTVNFPLGDIRANGVTSPLGSGGDCDLWFVLRPAKSTATTQLILDVTGYFQ